MKLHSEYAQKSWETVTCLLKTRETTEPNVTLQRKKKFSSSMRLIWNNVRCKGELKGLLELNFHHHPGHFLIHSSEVEQSWGCYEIPERANAQIIYPETLRELAGASSPSSVGSHKFGWTLLHWEVPSFFAAASHNMKQCKAAFSKI